MKKQIMFAVILGLTACTSKPVAPEPVMAPIEVPIVKASVLNRTIKDVDLRKGQEDKSPRKRVVVLPFLDRNSEHSIDILAHARIEFMNELNKSQEMIALDSSELKMDLSSFLKNGDFDLAAIAQASQNSNASSLLEAKVIDIRFKSQSGLDSDSLTKKAAFEIVVKARMMNIRTGQEIYNSVKTVTIEEENTKLPENIPSDIFFGRNPELVELLIKDAFLDFSSKLVEALNQVIWEGRIAALQGERIYLNVGKISGVQVGDILKVVEDGNEVYDPEIGYHIGKVPGKVKGTLEVVGYFGQDGAVSVIHSGAGFKENDRIELYE